MREDKWIYGAVSAGLSIAGLLAMGAANAAPLQQQLQATQDRITTEQRAQVRDRDRVQLPAEPLGLRDSGGQQSQQQWQNRYQHQYQRQSDPQYPPVQGREQYQWQLQDRSRYQQAPVSRPLQGTTPPATGWGGPRMGSMGGGRR